jgi:hypothetical protein
MSVIKTPNHFDIRSESFLKKTGYDTKQISGLLSVNKYLSVCEGMGCNSIIRKTQSGKLEGLYIDSQDSMVKFNAFTYGYTLLDGAPFIYHEW